MTSVKQNSVLFTTIGEAFQHRLIAVISAAVSQENNEDVQKQLHRYFSSIVNEEDARYLSTDALFGLINSPWGNSTTFRGYNPIAQNIKPLIVNLNMMIYEIGENKLCIEIFTNTHSMNYGMNHGFQNPAFSSPAWQDQGGRETPHSNHYSIFNNPNPFTPSSIDRTKSSKKIKQSEMIKVGEVVVNATSTEIQTLADKVVLV